MSVQNITSLEEFNALLAKPGLVVVDFTAVWCKWFGFFTPYGIFIRVGDVVHLLMIDKFIKRI